MKKRKKSKHLAVAMPSNPVAKFAHRFNKSQTFKTKNQYSRHDKHKGRELDSPSHERRWIGLSV